MLPEGLLCLHVLGPDWAPTFADERSASSLPLVSVSLSTPLTAADMAPYMKRLSRGQTVEGEWGLYVACGLPPWGAWGAASGMSGRWAGGPQTPRAFLDLLEVLSDVEEMSRRRPEILGFFSVSERVGRRRPCPLWRVPEGEGAALAHLALLPRLPDQPAAADELG